MRQNELTPPKFFQMMVTKFNSTSTPQFILIGDIGEV